MGCKKRTIKIAKTVAAAVSPPIVRFIGEMVEIVQQTDWANDQKRETVVELALGKAKQAGQEVKESAVRIVTEVAVSALKEGAEALAELGQDDDANEVVPV